jgi:hypothetical protein
MPLLIKLLIVSMLITTDTMLGQVISPGHYDTAADTLILNRNYFDDEEMYWDMHANVNRVFFEDNWGAVRSLLDKDFRHYETLLQLADIVIANKKVIDMHDTDIPRLHLYYASNKPKYIDDLLAYYFLEFLDTDQKVIDLFQLSTDPPLQTLLLDDSRMLMLYRHLASMHMNYIMEKSDIYMGKRSHMMPGFLQERSDCSLDEISNGQIKYEGTYKYCRNILNNSFKLSASSTLSGKYPTSNMTDFDLQSAWVEGANGLGIGEWITVNFDKTYMVAELIIFPGYGKSEELFYANGRLKEVELRFGESSKTFTFADGFYAQSISINANISNLKIIVKDAYPGTKYEDVCISEIMFLGPEKGAK